LRCSPELSFFSPISRTGAADKLCLKDSFL
jgi:hypothetical protein